MSKRDDLIEKYAADMKEKCGVTADMDFLRKVTIGCGPSIYNRDSSTVSATDASEIATVKNNFLIKKLGLKDGPELDAAKNPLRAICRKRVFLCRYNFAALRTFLNTVGKA